MRPPAALTPLLAAVLSALLLGPRDGRARLQSAGFSSPGQTVCRGGTSDPATKSLLPRRFAQGSASRGPRGLPQGWRSAGQRRVRGRAEPDGELIRSLAASDGDFWIGLRRRMEEKAGPGPACGELYAWVDGSPKWYADEPSCGNEVCVVLYHQPSAPAGPGGPYLFQWNDDRCHMKNNFICKYSDGNGSCPSWLWGKSSLESGGLPFEAGLNILSILIPSISLLLLLAATAAVGCVWIGVKRRREGAGPRPKKQRAGAPLPAPSSPNLEVYNVIRKQDEADLAGARPAPKNISFLPRPGTGDTPRPPIPSRILQQGPGNQKDLGSNPGSIICPLCDLRQVVSFLWASVTSSVKWGLKTVSPMWERD
uniref:Layilin n=1 Tax=Ornithorhynchus anatinus TaxID=9258 RepID=A0A6I8PDP7_ORNAN